MHQFGPAANVFSAKKTLSTHPIFFLEKLSKNGTAQNNLKKIDTAPTSSHTFDPDY